LRRAASLSVEPGVVASYVHNQVSEGLGKIGVLVALQSTGPGDELADFGRKIAMHIAASPALQALDAASLDPAVVARERQVLAEKFRAQGKPEHMIDKIVESGLKTFYKEVCLIDQPYIHDPDKSVGQALKDAESRVGTPIKIVSYVRYVLGEGVDKSSLEAA